MRLSNLQSRCAAEFVGTFTIVFAPVAFSGSEHGFGKYPSLMSSALVSGLAVTAMIYALGPICNAHFNPAVTLGFAITKRFPRTRVVPYIASQLLGAIAGALLSALFFGAGHGTHIPQVNSLKAIGIEAVLTFFLMFVIAAVATDKRVHASVPGLAIGAVVVFDVLIGGPVTGGSMNPARSLGPALVSGGAALADCWVYIVGPIAGSLAGALLYEFIRDDHLPSSYLETNRHDTDAIQSVG